MLNYILPIVFFCAAGQSGACDGHTAILKHELDATATPMDCLLKGTVDATQYIIEFEKDHPNKKLEYRILCKSSSQKT